LLTVLHILMTLYQDVNATEVQDEKLSKFRRKVVSTAIKENINEVWSILQHTLTVSGLRTPNMTIHFREILMSE